MSIKKAVKVYVMFVEKDNRKTYYFFEKKSDLEKAVRRIAKKTGIEPGYIIRGE